MTASLAADSITEASTSKFVQTKKWRLHYNEAGSGHAVIMLHGTGPGATGWTNFSPNIGPLSRKYRVILLDLPGWGRSDAFDPTAEPRTASHALAVKLLMDELGLKQAALVGNSMGGLATQQFAVSYPERMSHYITMGASGGGQGIFSPGGLTEGWKIIQETYEDPSPRNFRRLVTAMVYDSAFVTDSLCESRSRAALANPEHLANWLKPLKQGKSARPSPAATYEMLTKLGEIKVPALLVHGRDDRVVALENSLRLVGVIQNSRLVVFNRCGHWAQVEHAKEFNALVDGFLS